MTCFIFLNFCQSVLYSKVKRLDLLSLFFPIWDFYFCDLILSGLFLKYCGVGLVFD